MTNKTIGLLHPGAMGSTLGQSAAAGGNRVVWAGEGRSEASRKRAAESQLEDVGSLASLVQSSDIIFSVCPPHSALELATEIAAEKFTGIFVDCNAVSTETTRATQQVIEKQGASFVDGGIIGPPAHREGSTRLYLSGKQADDIVPLLSKGLLPGISISDKPGDASVLKMAYASYTKGHSALLLLSRALASSAGIEQHLLDEWALSQPNLEARCASEGAVAASKAWRFNGEMREIASTMQSAGLPPDFHEGAAEIYDRLAGFKPDTGDASSGLPEIEDIIASLVKR
jgi:3-hydroxyisobutyrate dehydrogenase-like beta-hydroxyacid dehydrogenase